MAHVFVTFVGSGSLQPTSYRFDGETTAPRGRLAGLAILRHLQTKTASPLGQGQEAPRPETMIVLGTSGSRWDMWYDALPSSPATRAAAGALARRADADSVGEDDLEDLRNSLEKKLHVDYCQLRLVPYGRTVEEQLQIFGTLANLVHQGDDLSLDVTHALRHLPMIALLAAFQLEALREVKLQHFYYAAYEIEKAAGVTQVLELKGLIQMAKWIGALHTFNTNRDYGVFVELLKDDMRENVPEDVCDKLRVAAFAEQVQRLDVAHDSANEVVNWLNAQRADRKLGVISSEFAGRLLDHLEWTKQSGYQQRAEFARRALKDGNLWHATLFGFEAFVTRLAENPDQFAEPMQNPPPSSAPRPATGPKKKRTPGPREQARKKFEEFWKKLEQIAPEDISEEDRGVYERFKWYRNLQNLRNAVAHGEEQALEEKPMGINTDITGLIRDSKEIEHVLRESFKRLLD